ncbi:PglL family O-oligosaccharyltransferase [Rubrivivax gelatinosus]|nr:O-antigen ligase family protein [Rubrivivax gelatinosus]
MRSFAVLLALVPVAWLVSNHYAPWVSAWSDGLVLVLVASSLSCWAGPSRIDISLLAVLVIGSAVALAQWASGQVFFFGDALMVVLYLCAFAAALMLGRALPGDSGRRLDGLTSLAAVMVASAALSVGIALAQWMQVAPLGVWQVDLPPGTRPFGNVAQANHLCTVALLGISAAGLLFQSARIGKAVFFLCTAWLLFGMVMSGSRTGWLQIAALLVIALTVGARTRWALARREAVALAVGFALLAAGWPAFNDWLGLSSGRSLEQAVQPGTRYAHWTAMLDALRQQPWSGYGWQQVARAQHSVAADRPYVGENIEHAHNIVLDLLVWNGVPLGLLLVALLVWGLLRTFRGCRDPRSAWLLLGAAGILVHGMLEYPLEYAYFLIPLGLFIGATQALERPAEGVVLPSPLPRVGGLVLMTLVAAIGYEYAQVETSFRTLRMEAARIGTATITSETPDLRLLTQQRAFQDFIRTEARTGMSPSQLETMRSVAERFPYPPVMLRYALASALNGHPREAELEIRRLCRMHRFERCEEAYDAWTSITSQQPLLRQVALPPTALAAAGLTVRPPPP